MLVFIMLHHLSQINYIASHLHTPFASIGRWWLQSCSSKLWLNKQTQSDSGSKVLTEQDLVAQGKFPKLLHIPHWVTPETTEYLRQLQKLKKHLHTDLQLCKCTISLQEILEDKVETNE